MPCQRLEQRTDGLETVVASFVSEVRQDMVKTRQWLLLQSPKRHGRNA